MASSSTVADHLIQTKLYPPRVPDRLVNRRQLLDRLSSGSVPSLTLISAPAGYGKSTLAHQWLDALKIPYAWLSLDEYDSDLPLFLDYLLAAIGMVFPEMGTETEEMLKQPPIPRVAHLADSLVRDLKALSGPLYLAIDDYHTISDRNVHFFMERLLQHLPADLYLVLISRADPPLALARMRASGQLREIRSANLRFSQDEAVLLLEEIVGRPVSGATAEVLAEHTEGWAVGLRMAAMSLRESRDEQSFVERYRTMGQRLVTDYLLSEVLQQMPREQQVLFLKTAVADRFSASLVDALVGDASLGSGGQNFIDLLWSSNFFLIALDDQGDWYRYHHLFRQLLQQRMANELLPQEIAVLHQKAGAWFEQAGLINDAIVHYVKGGVGERAARVIEGHAHEALNREEWRSLERWVNLLPVEYQNRPGLLAVQAALGQLQMRFSALDPLLDAAEQGLDSGAYGYSPEEARSWKGMIAVYRGVVFSAANSPQYILQQVEEALDNLDESATYVRGMAENWEIVALHQSGRTSEAIEKVRQTLEHTIDPLDARTHRHLVALANVYYCEADVVNMHNFGQYFKSVALRTDHHVSLGWANFILGSSAYQKNELQEAITHFNAVAASRYFVHVRCAVDSLTGLALSQSASGRAEDAAETLVTMREFLMDQDRYMLLPLVDSLQARLEADWGAVTIESVLGGDALQQLAADTWEKPLLTACRAAILQGDSGMLFRVESTLAECTEFAMSRNNRRQLIQLGVLEALLLERRGKHQEALAGLQTAVLRGEPYGALRIFADFGRELLPLLQTLRDQDVAPDYITRILAVCEETAEPGEMLTEEETGAPVGLSHEAAAVMADLTNREMEVLILLGERLSNKEIAAKLYISPHTVKKYTLVIYQKLAVDGRRQAVVRAIELGIL